MIAANYRMVNTVVNRCKMPDDGDILVPIQTVAVIGTTDERVADPERFAIEQWEIDLMLEEGEKLVPGFKEDADACEPGPGFGRFIRKQRRPRTRDVTRAYTLLDHEQRDGVGGFITITGGKWTTYRQMAEVTADRVCEKLGGERPCLTKEEILPNLFAPEQRSSAGYHYLGARLQRTESREDYGGLICECEMATRADVEWAITEGEAKTVDDVRRDGEARDGAMSGRLLHRAGGRDDSCIKKNGCDGIECGFARFFAGAVEGNTGRFCGAIN